MKKQLVHPEPPENYTEILDKRINEIETAEFIYWEKIQTELKLFIKQVNYQIRTKSYFTCFN